MRLSARRRWLLAVVVVAAMMATAATVATGPPDSEAVQADWDLAVAAVNRHDWREVASRLSALEVRLHDGGLALATRAKLEQGAELLRRHLAAGRWWARHDALLPDCSSARGAVTEDLCAALELLDAGEHGEAIRMLYALDSSGLPAATAQFVSTKLLPSAYQAAAKAAGDAALVSSLAPASRNVGASDRPGALTPRLQEALDHALRPSTRPAPSRLRSYLHHLEVDPSDPTAVAAAATAADIDDGGGEAVLAAHAAGQDWPGLPTWTSIAAQYWPRSPATAQQPLEADEGDPDQGMLHGTATAQRIIHAHQNPRTADDCAQRRYLLASTGYLTGHGIGSVLHILASNLGLAMSLNRTLILLPNDGNTFCQDGEQPHPTSSAFRCGAQTSFECFIRPLSTCTADHQLHFQRVLSQHAGAIDWWLPSTAHETVDAPILKVMGDKFFRSVPPQLKPVAFGAASCANPEAVSAGADGNQRGSPLDATQGWYWWRAQAVAYIMRLNEPTVAEIQRRIALQLPQHPSGLLPPGVISAHVRHGDKGIEMKVLPSSDYLTTAAALEASSVLNGSLEKQIFVSTEDPEVVAKSAAWGQQHGWAVHFTRAPRANVPIFELLRRFGGVNEVLNGFANLFLAVQCDAWICTLASNWCSLIDELRSTVARKAHQPYVNIGHRCFQGCEDG